jgi:isopropylmalate/homocitrate/citramalate synthase
MSEPWKTDKWYTTPWNFLDEVTRDYRFADSVKIHDMTLRDGEQQAGVEFTKDDKVRIAEKLAEAGVHRIEAGMPATSKQDEAAIREIVSRNLGPEIFVLCRSVIDDVKLAADCGADGIIIETLGSRHLIKYGHGWPEEKALEVGVQATTYAKEQGLYTSLFLVDSTREDVEWVVNLVESIAKDGHADSAVLVDTMGVLTPASAAYFVRKAKERLTLPLEAHFHDDFGMGTANTLVGLACGAEVAHTAVCGLGERSGSAATEEVAAALMALYGIDAGIKYEKLYDLAQLVVKLSGHRLPQNKAIVGEQLYAVESGIVASRLKKCPGPLVTEVFTMHWDFMGQKPPVVVLGKGSGKDNILYWLDKLGLAATKEQVRRMMVLVKDKAMAEKRLLTEEEFREIATQVLAEEKEALPAT